MTRGKYNHYKIRGIPLSKDRKNNISKSLIGKNTWSKGRSMSDETKEKIRKNIATNSNFGMRGKKRTKEANLKAVATRMKNGSYSWSKEQREKAKQRVVSNEVKEKISKTLTGIKRGPMKDITKEKFRILMAKRIIERGYQNVGKNEKFILDELEKLFKLKIQRQYSVKGYLLDGYIKELNLAIEVDESFHFNCSDKLKKENILRQKKIEEELKCKFLRIRDKY